MYGLSTFGVRVLCLLGLMAIVVVFDVLRNGARASKHREYGFILLAGALGAGVGFCNDLVTSTISPEYFIYGKGLAAGEGLRLEAGWYGMKAGFAAGIVGGAVCLFLGSKKSLCPLALRPLIFALWMPLAGAIVFGLILPLLAGQADPFRLGDKLTPLLDAEQIARFLRVWWIHIGLYAGMIIGLAAMVVRVVRQKFGRSSDEAP